MKFQRNINDMAFKKGESGNPLGKPKGIKSKITKPFIERLTAFLEDDFNGFLADWDGLTKSERTKARIALYEYIIPKIRRSELTIDLSKMDDSEVERLLDMAVTKISSDESK